MTLYPHYNPSDDFFYLGSEKLPYRAYLNAIPIYINGQFGVDVGNGTYSNHSATASSSIRPFTNSNNVLTPNITANNQISTLVTDDIIDFSQYSKVNVVINGSTFILDVSSLNQNGYVALSFYTTNTTNANNTYAYVKAVSQKQYFDQNLIGNYNLQLPSLIYSNFKISSITVE